MESKTKHRLIITDDMVKEMVSLSTDFTAHEIAEKMNLSYGNVSKHLRKNGVKPLKKYVSHKERKISDKTKLIIELSKQGIGCRKISKQLGVTDKYVCQVKRKYNIDKVELDKPSIGYLLDKIPEGWEYIDGYTHSEGFINVRHIKCGNIISKSVQVFRKGHGDYCEYCSKNKAAERKEKEQELKKIDTKISNWKKMAARSYVQSSFKTCPVCNSVFVGNSKYCSKYCSDHNRWEQKEGYRYKFPLEEVYKKDNGICYICGGKCDWDDYYIDENGYTVYGNNYPSRDHVFPKSKGGKNEWNNIKLAHRICNSLKSDKVANE